MSSGSQGSMNKGELGKSPNDGPLENKENLRPGSSWIPSGSFSSNDASNPTQEQSIGSDPDACSVDKIQNYIGNECPEIFEYYSSIGMRMTDSRTKVCLEDIGINPDESCSVLKSDLGDIRCRRFCRADCLEDMNKPEHLNYLPSDCPPLTVTEQSTIKTEPVTSATTPSVTTRVTSSTTINAATESDSENTLAIGLGAGLGGLLLIVLVILGIYFFKNRKRGEILEYYKPFDVLPL